MTVAEHDALNLPIRWAIYEKDQVPGFRPELLLDLGAPVPDGEYDVVYLKKMISSGVIVKNSKFNIKATTKAVAKLVRPYHAHKDGTPIGKDEKIPNHVIERIDWNGEHFEVGIAS